MSRYTEPRFTISRREGVNLTGTTSKRLEEVLQVPLGGPARPEDPRPCRPEHIGADSLPCLSYDGMIQTTGLPESRFSTPCFGGVYPVEIGDVPTEAPR